MSASGRGLGERELSWIDRELKEIGPQADGDVMNDDWLMIIDCWLLIEDFIKMIWKVKKNGFSSRVLKEKS